MQNQRTGEIEDQTRLKCDEELLWGGGGRREGGREGGKIVITSGETDSDVLI